MAASYTSLSSIQYLIPGDKIEGRGDITMDGLTHQVYFFEADWGTHEDLTLIKMKSTQVFDSCLLVPLTVLPINGSVAVAYIFDRTFQEAMDGNELAFLLFSDNGIIVRRWGVQVLGIIETVSRMHDKFLYHGDLNNPRSYSYIDDSIRIVMPRHLHESKDDTLAKEDWIALGAFFKNLVGNGVSLEWDNFINCFNNPDINVLKKHPVLRNSYERYDYMRALLARFNSRWDNLYEDWEDFRVQVHNADEICPNWTAIVKVEGPEYTDVYYEKSENYRHNDNCCLLSYVGNVMKHQENTGRSADDVERDLHRMFPAFATRVHSIFTEISSNNPKMKVLPW